ncbi:MAG: DUF4339 domain-containing protein [bacterium]|nr:DUF4339 domain-containing protein [bacterium]
MWHYELNGEHQPPVHLEAIKTMIAQGQITPQTLVWQDGMTEWLPAEQTPLQPFLPRVAPFNPYEDLIKIYGQENVEKALLVFQKVKKDFPHLSVLNIGELAFSGHLLNFAAKSVEKAAANDRIHTMEETIDIIGQVLGGWLVKNPSENWPWAEDTTIKYAGEGSGCFTSIIICFLVTSSIYILLV